MSVRDKLNGNYKWILEVLLIALLTDLGGILTFNFSLDAAQNTAIEERITIREFDSYTQRIGKQFDNINIRLDRLDGKLDLIIISIPKGAKYKGE